MDHFEVSISAMSTLRIGHGAKLNGFKCGSMNVEFGDGVVMNNIILDTKSPLKATQNDGLVVSIIGTTGITSVQLLTPAQLAEGDWHVKEDTDGKFIVKKL